MDRKNECMKGVMRIKETNRYFFTQNPTAPPYYYPERSIIDERATSTTKDSSSPNDTDVTLNETEVTPRTQAARDYKKLFGDSIVPIPCEAGRIKKALDERRKRDGKTGEDEERVAAALLRKEREQKIARKLKTTKEIYTVAADYSLSPDGSMARVALALID